MGIKQSLTGTPWHVEKMTRNEGDEKRHRSRCVFFRKKDRYCNIRCCSCFGSAHCPYYEEKTIAVNNAANNQKKEITVPPIKNDEMTIDEKRRAYPFFSRVYSKKYGYGTVKMVRDTQVVVVFDNGEERTFDIQTFVQKNLLMKL